jgi:heptosyltransferase-2
VKNILVIQTAFIGDVILATAVLEKLHAKYPHARLDMLVRSGNEQLLEGHPYVTNVLVWHKRRHKYINLWKLFKHIRGQQFDLVVNLQRYTAAAFLTAFSGGRQRVGFDSSILSLGYTLRLKHTLGSNGELNYAHEVDRCLALVKAIAGEGRVGPKLYPTAQHRQRVDDITKGTYVTISPASVWFTKQTPASVWRAMIAKAPNVQFYLLGAPSDEVLCREIAVGFSNVELLAGKYSLLESAVIQEHAQMNFTNDSAPLHLCSAMNAPVTAVFCSTIPEFGFGPLADDSAIVQTHHTLSCKPCGIHGKSACPKGHFRCGEISPHELLKRITSHTS